MIKLVATAICMVIALGLCAFVVCTFNDRSTLVPPPEQVSEAFFKQIKTSRYSRAIPLLDSQMKTDTDTAKLKQFKKDVEWRIGKMRDVSGKDTKIQGDSALAVTELKGESGRMTVQMKLTREQGVWKVSGVFPFF